MATSDLLSYLLLPLAALLLTHILISRTRSKRALPPSPPGFLPILGHLLLIKKPLHRCLASLSSLYGHDVLLLHFGSRRTVVVSSAAAAEQCFTSDTDVVFANRPSLPSMKHITNNFKNLVFGSYGPYWRNLRRIATLHFLSNNRLLSSSHVRADESHQLIRHLFDLAAAAGGSTKVDLREVVFTYALNVITRMLTGKREKEVSWFRGVLEQAAVSAGTDNLQNLFPVIAWLDVGGVQRRSKRLGKERSEYTQRILDEHNAGKGGPDSMIGHLLDLQRSDPEAYSDSYIKSLCMSLLQAGTDTVSTTIVWAMSLLLNHREELMKVQAEIDSTVGTSRLLQESDLVGLLYLQCIITETLRLYPAAPLLVPHESSSDCSVAGYNIPGGSMLLVNAYAIHRDPKIWEDADKFIPERFLKGGILQAGGKLMLPFGMGRRKCPGEALALKVVGLCLGLLIQCFDWRRIGEDEVDMTEGEGLTMPRAFPLDAMYSPRPEMMPLLVGQ